jgi:glycosyltransferase involved in cell wall biosynthesis
VTVRIAIISSRLPPDDRGGSYLYAAHLAQALAANHEILVVSGSVGLPSPGIARERVPSLPPLSPASALPVKVFWHALDQWRPSVYRALAGHLRRFSPDVVHTHVPQGLSAAVFTAVGRSPGAHVHTAHDLNLLCAQAHMTRAGRFCGGACARCAVQRAIRGRALSGHLDQLIAPSDFIRAMHVDARLVPEELAVTVRHGAEPGRVRVRTGDRQELRVGYMGALRADKGILTVLDAVRSAAAGWTLAVAGNGPLEAVVKRRAETDSRVSFVGYVDGDNKDRFLDGIDLMVIPSEVEEAASLVAAEAAVRGLPSVVSDRGALPEVVEARVFPAGSAHGLDEAIRWFGADTSRLARASRRLVELRDCFLWSSHVNEVERILTYAARQGGVRSSEVD